MCTLSLVDLMVVVPRLLDYCTVRMFGQPGTIKAVRLVCKQLSVTALQSVKLGFVQLGGTKAPLPRQMVKIMGVARLDVLVVVVVTTSGWWLCSEIKVLHTYWDSIMSCS